MGDISPVVNLRRLATTLETSVSVIFISSLPKCFLQLKLVLALLENKSGLLLRVRAVAAGGSVDRHPTDHSEEAPEGVLALFD